MNPAKFWFNFIKNPSQLDDDLTYAPLNSVLTEDENTNPWSMPQGLGLLKRNINILNDRAVNRGKSQAKVDIIRNLQSLGVPYTSAYIAADAAVQGNYKYYQKLLSKYSNNNNNAGMYDASAVNSETDEISSGNVVVGGDPEEKTKTPPTVASVVRPKKAIKTTVNNTPVVKPAPAPISVQTPVSTPVAAPTLSSVVPQAVRHNGGFDNYRRESVLSALRAAGGISPAEAVQRGIIPWEALNYI